MTKPFFPATNLKDSINDQEQSILQYWKDKNIFQKTIESRNPVYTYKFFDGPPFATGTPHYGHILAGAIKDAIPRYKTMQGYRVDRKFGWDCHGVPVEFQVEKEHQIGGKPGIEKMGVAEFNERCRSIVLRCADQWESTVDRMGRFVDFKDDYKTMQPEFMESVWWVFKSLWDKGLIYEGEKVVAYSPKLGSPLSNFEANLNYSDIDDPAVTVKFELTKNSAEKLLKGRLSCKKDPNPKNTFILAWTTTPWTLPSNLALCVNPSLDYAIVTLERFKGEHGEVKYSKNNGKNISEADSFDGTDNFVVAVNLVEKIFENYDYGEQVDKERPGFWKHSSCYSQIRGKDLVGLKYEPLFPFFAEKENAFHVLGDPFVDESSGTGIVHMAPNFGEDDARVCAENGISYLDPNPIDGNGYFSAEISELDGKYFRADPEVDGSKENNANDWVIEQLKIRGNLLKREQIRHSYPHCWRTDCALMYRGIETWFVDVQKIKDTMLEQNQNINWIPSHLKDGRFGKLLESAPDWAISRNRYWGAPIPVWRCDVTGKVEVIGSHAQLTAKSGTNVDDLHKHFVDDLTWPSPFDPKGTMRRIPEVLDCWFESGSMPYGSVHYPFANAEKQDLKNNFYTVRHAESENNAQKIYSSKLANKDEFGLTKKGREQAKNSAEKVSEPIDMIVCSPFRRCRETAEIFAEKLGIEIQFDERLREIDLGDFDGQAERDFGNDDPDAPTAKTGESLADCQHRMVDCIRELDQKFRGKNILIVSHGGPLNALNQWADRVELSWSSRAGCPKNAVVQKLELKKSAEKNTISVVRHGESEKNFPIEIESCSHESAAKYPLTEKGKKDAETEAKKYENSFDIIIASPFLRTKETAEIFRGKNPNAELIFDDRLIDINVGDFDEKPLKECRAWKKANNFTPHTQFPNGESFIDVQNRLKSLLKELSKKYQNKRILIVGHGCPLEVLLDTDAGKEITLWDKCLEKSTVFQLKNSAEVSDFQPADFIAEGLDQTRGWFYTLHVLGCALFGKNIYKNVITNGIVLAEDGQKMSKSKKNYPDPNIVFEKYGADAMRFYLLSSPVVRGENFRFTERGVEEVLKSVILPLKSAYQFFSTYANIDGWKPTKFTFLRHGEGEHNVAGIYSGLVENDHHLTEKGRTDVAQTAEHIADFDTLISSPFLRTRETAEIAKKIRGFSGEIQIDDRVQEPYFGNLEGKPHIPPQERHANKTSESPDSVQGRINEFLQDTSQKFRGKHVLVCSHGSPIRHAQAYKTHTSTLDELLRIPYVKPGNFRALFAIPQTENELDAWILSELQTTMKTYREHFEAYDLEAALRGFAPFIDNLNNWYLRRSRRRFWADGLDEDKRGGYETLHYVLLTMSKMLAPICPFFAEKLFQDLGGSGSVHLEYLPHPRLAWIDETAEERIGIVREIVSLAAGIRSRKKIKLRQPLQKLRFSTTSSVAIDLDVVKAEANVEAVEILSDEKIKTYAQQIVRVNARLVGKRLGAKVQAVIQAGKNGEFELLANGQVKISAEIFAPEEYEFGFVTTEGVEAEATSRTVVLLDTDITPELREAGLARELIRSIQDLRKTSGFDVSDRISVAYATESQIIKNVWENFRGKISDEVLATEVHFLTEVLGETLDLDGETITIKLEKL